MSTITNTITTIGPTNKQFIVLWSAMGDADTGTAFEIPGTEAHSVQVVGTFGGATATIQGSNDGTNYATLSDPQGNALTFTSSRLEAIEEVSRYIRAITSGGTGTNVSVYLFTKGI